MGNKKMTAELISMPIKARMAKLLLIGVTVFAASALPVETARSQTSLPEMKGPFLKQNKAYDLVTDTQAEEIEAYTLGVQAYLWGMKWVRFGQSHRIFAAPLPEGKERSPVDYTPHDYNVFGHARVPLSHEVAAIERPNTETPYSAAVVDLRNGPVVLIHPEIKDRYYRTPIWAGDGKVYYVSQKKDGSQADPVALVRTGWKGTLPKGLKSIEIGADNVLVFPHTGLMDTPDKDMANVLKIQDGYKLIALDDFGPGKINKAMDPLPRKLQLHPLLVEEVKASAPPPLWFYGMLSQVLLDIDIPEKEVGFYEQLNRIGITLGKFDFKNLSPAQVAGLTRATYDAQAINEHKARNLVPKQENSQWQVMYDFDGNSDWLFRAAIGWRYVGGGNKSEVLFPQLDVDSDGSLLHSDHKYTMTFEKGKLVPANYWRISIYDKEGFFAENKGNRYGIGNLVGDKPKVNKDGSLTIYIQREKPSAEKIDNWLPTPAGTFSLLMRMYQPHEIMYRGKYTIPDFVKTKQ
jgi:hypothetical protein